MAPDVAAPTGSSAGTPTAASSSPLSPSATPAPRPDDRYDEDEDEWVEEEDEEDDAPARSWRDYLPALLPIARPRWTPRYREWAVLGLILIAGAVFRFTGVNWDGGQHLHPDERFLTMVEGAIKAGIATRTTPDGPTIVQPASLFNTYFDTARSALNPHNVGFGFYVYGTFPLFAVRAIAELTNSVGYDKVHLLGRVLSALSDLVTVWLVYLIGRRLYGPRAGLLAAAFSAFCVLQIQQAHFFVFDSFLVTLITASFYFCVEIAESGRLRSFALAGSFLGLALATKLSMVVFAPIIGLAALIHLWRTEIGPRGLSADSIVLLWEGGALRRAVLGGALALFLAALLFRVFQPYAFAGPGFFDLRLNPRWLDNISYQAKTQAGTVDLPPNIQWAGTEPLLFPWRHMVAWGLGIPLGLTVWAGLAAAIAVILWRGRWQHLLVASWAILCFVYFASVLNKTMRYILPAYPFFILLGAWALLALYEWTKRQRSAISAGHTVSATEGASLSTDGALAPRAGGPLSLWGRVRVRATSFRPLVARFGPPAVLALTTFVVVATGAWAYAFTRIYTRPVTRVQASLWIYQNVPRGAVMANEHWDDPLPVPMPGYDHGRYAGPQLPLYDPDEPRKLDTLVRMLSQADYINITSNRLYGSIPRIPQRYPMTIEYYRRLFAGELGFKLVHTETSYPQLGPWVINDDRAEEAFTVYDHPKVFIFQKQPDFSAERVRQILSAVPLDNVVQLLPAQVGKPDLTLPPDMRETYAAGGTWSHAFSLDGVMNHVAPLVWLLAVQALGLLAAPLVWLLFGRVPDRGYGVSKALGILAVSWLAWLAAGYRLLPWTRLTILLAALTLAAATAVVLRRHGAAWLAWLRTHRRLVLTTEAIVLGAFLAFTLLRMLNPDLWHPARGGEKPMEFSYLNAVIRTVYFPPYDPWFAGGYLNYYYFGYVLVAALTKLTGVMPSIAFNLAIPTLYALTAAGCFSFAYNLACLGGRPGLSDRTAVAAGIAGFALVAVAGNLDGFSQLLERLARAGGVAVHSALPGVSGLMSLVAGLPAVVFGGRPIEPFDFWRSSRIIPNNTINEFPFWTFLFADLHAHLISIPFQVVGLGWLLNVVFGGLKPAPSLTHGPRDEGPARWFWRLTGRRRLVEIVVSAWLVGALYVINSWEFPTYLLLTAGAFFIAEFAAQRGLTLGGLARAATAAAGVFLLAKAFYQPFWSYYVTFYSSVTPWTTDKSRLTDYLTIHGLLIFSLVTLLALLGWPAWRHAGWVRYLRARWRWVGAWDRFSELETIFITDRRLPAGGYLLLVSITGALALGFLLRGLPLIAFLVTMLAITLGAAWERRHSPALLLAALLGATGFALGIFVEFFALQGDVGRMNTVFKFYLQVWVMWGLISGVALVWAADRLRQPDVQAELVAAPAAAAPIRGPLLYEDPVAAGAGDGDAPDWPAHQHPASTQAHPRPAALQHAGAGAPRSLTGLQWAWVLAAGGLLLAAGAYPLGATPARLADRFNPLPPTLDGMAYMRHTTIADGYAEVTANHPGGVNLRAFADYEAIRWLLTNVEGTPVVLEASIPEYRWGSRIAKYTGLPTVLGWRWHQAQQRGTYAPQVDQRLRDVQTMFNDPSPARIAPLLEKYQVRYIYVGDLERAYYARNGLAKFDQMSDALRPVYQSNGVTIYEVVATATRPR